MDPDRYRDLMHCTVINYPIIKDNPKNKKGKRAKNWETQYKNIWNGRKR